jgi:uncharacterized membrane protein
MNWILRLLKQPSTWRGLIFLVTAGGAAISEEQATAIITAGIAVAGAVGAFTSD